MTDNITDAAKMVDRLPYTITKGVTATWEGLVFNRKDADLCLPNQWALAMRVSWPDAAERLHYRDGEPWCHAAADNAGIIMGGYKPLYPDDGYLLHRLAAILCDTAEAFRVLHWCVTNLGGKSDE